MDTECFDILLFSAVKILSPGFMRIVPPFAFMLKQVIEEGMTDVFSAIQRLRVSGSLPSGNCLETMENSSSPRKDSPRSRSLSSLSGSLACHVG